MELSLSSCCARADFLLSILTALGLACIGLGEMFSLEKSQLFISGSDSLPLSFSNLLTDGESPDIYREQRKK